MTFMLEVKKLTNQCGFYQAVYDSAVNSYLILEKLHFKVTFYEKSTKKTYLLSKVFQQNIYNDLPQNCVTCHKIRRWLYVLEVRKTASEYDKNCNRRIRKLFRRPCKFIKWWLGLDSACNQLRLLLL